MGLTRLRRRLDTIQRLRWFRIVATVVLLGAAGGFFGSLISIRTSWDTQAEAITAKLSGEEAVTWGLLLRDDGEFTIDGRTYSAPLDVVETLIAEDGSPKDVQRVVFLLLRGSIPSWAPRWLLLETAIAWQLMSITILVGVSIIWMGLLVSVLMLLVGGTVFATLFWLFGWSQWVGVPLAIGVLLSTYLMLIRGLQLILSGRRGWMAVAHTLLWEASRTRLALAFVVTLLIALPLLPLSLNLEAPIDQVVQAYLARSLSLAFLVTAFMVLLLGCGTICFDIRDRHIWHLTTKPLGRASYLFGKWAGVMLLGGVMLTVAGSWSFGYIQFLRTSNLPRTTAEFLAQEDLLNDVLVARTSMRPVYEELDEVDMTGRIDQIILEDPAFAEYAEGDIPLATYRTLRKRVFDEFDQQRRSVETLLDPATVPWKTLHFEDLGEARAQGLPLRLKFRLYGGLSDEHSRCLIGVATGDDLSEAVLGPFIPTLPQHIDIAPSAINEDGSLDVSIVNLTQHAPPKGDEWRGPVDLQPLAMSGGNRAPFAVFWLEDEFEIGYPKGTFGSNFLRGLLVLWLKLAVLAGFACGVSTTLSFPVACLVVFSAYAAASIAPWLSLSLVAYGAGNDSPETTGEYIQWGIEAIVRTVAGSMVYLLRRFGELQPIDQLIAGKMVTWAWFREALAMAVFWGGGAMVVGWFVLTRRHLASYSGDQ